MPKVVVVEGQKFSIRDLMTALGFADGEYDVTETLNIFMSTGLFDRDYKVGDA